ncbi:MAG: hypothetical protein ACR2H3_12710 [Acidimicrobiales bacterium]
MSQSTPVECRCDAGMIAGLESLVIGTLVFVFGTLLIANAWAVVDAKLAVQAAAREATRAFVEAGDTDEGWRAASQAAADTIEGHGRNPATVKLAAPDAVLGRCASVRFTASYPVRLLPLSLIGRAGGEMTVSASHSEVVDAHRSGLPGTALC